jgi:hypothetical protein
MYSNPAFFLFSHISCCCLKYFPHFIRLWPFLSPEESPTAERTFQRHYYCDQLDMYGGAPSSVDLPDVPVDCSRFLLADFISDYVYLVIRWSNGGIFCLELCSLFASKDSATAVLCAEWGMRAAGPLHPLICHMEDTGCTMRGTSRVSLGETNSVAGTGRW